ncbi:hypothetical protein [Microbacterium sp. NPDC077486]|uniref:hypothetical protein n=1 Tax=Microbacterium sp. NPDC077486 TaxID=3154766 RepID=UPI003419DCCD
MSTVPTSDHRLNTCRPVFERLNGKSIIRAVIGGIDDGPVGSNNPSINRKLVRKRDTRRLLSVRGRPCHDDFIVRRQRHRRLNITRIRHKLASNNLARAGQRRCRRSGFDRRSHHFSVIDGVIRRIGR